MFRRLSAPLLSQPNPPNRPQMVEYTIQAHFENSGLLEYSLKNGTLSIEIERAFVPNESDTVMLHGVELIYPALF